MTDLEVSVRRALERAAERAPDGRTLVADLDRRSVGPCRSPVLRSPVLRAGVVVAVAVTVLAVVVGVVGVLTSGRAGPSAPRPAEPTVLPSEPPDARHSTARPPSGRSSTMTLRTVVVETRGGRLVSTTLVATTVVDPTSSNGVTVTVTP
jgi:hypothetical protein